MPFDLALYLVTDAALCAETGLEATVEAAVKGGVTMVYLIMEQFGKHSDLNQ